MDFRREVPGPLSEGVCAAAACLELDLVACVPPDEGLLATGGVVALATAGLPLTRLGVVSALGKFGLFLLGGRPRPRFCSLSCIADGVGLRCTDSSLACAGEG